MISIDRSLLAEPADFDSRCRQPGIRWLNEHAAPARPRDYWTQFKPRLADGFRNLCAYSAMYEPVGTVDHFESVTNRRQRAYDWDNYRFASAWVNSSKSKAQQVLDPFLIEDGWFRILLPSLQMMVTDQVPGGLRALAEETVRRLHLSDDERVIRQRREWYRMYQEGQLSLDGLRTKAPLIARAIDDQVQSSVP